MDLQRQKFNSIAALAAALPMPRLFDVLEALASIHVGYKSAKAFRDLVRSEITLRRIRKLPPDQLQERFLRLNRIVSPCCDDCDILLDIVVEWLHDKESLRDCHNWLQSLPRPSSSSPEFS